MEKEFMNLQKSKEGLFGKSLRKEREYKNGVVML